MIEDKFAMTFIYIFNDVQAQGVGGLYPLFSRATIIWNDLKRWRSK